MNTPPSEVGGFPNTVLARAIGENSRNPQIDHAEILATAAAFAEFHLAGRISWMGIGKAYLTDEQGSLTARAADALHIELGIPILSAEHPTVIDGTAPEGTLVFPIERYTSLIQSRRDHFLYASGLLLTSLQGKAPLPLEQCTEALSAAPEHITRAIAMFWRAAANALSDPEVVQSSGEYKRLVAAIYLGQMVTGKFTTLGALGAHRKNIISAKAIDAVRASAEEIRAETGVELTPQMLKVLTYI